MEYQSFKIFDQEVKKVVEGLRVADCMNLQEFEEEAKEEDETTLSHNLKDLAVSEVLSCSYCSVSFADALHQRSHYKLDWHRYNLKRALTGNKPISEEVFSTLEDEMFNISESESESESETERSDKSENKTSEPIESENFKNFKNKYKSFRNAKVFFENHENKVLSVYRCLLHSKKENLVKDELVERVHDLIEKSKKWMIILLGGGHFASAIFSDGEILHHKTFHCYTVRAKQGGSQASKDNKGGSHPKSAGASLRRYNEQALVQHVQDIITSWSDIIKQCSLILYRATGPYNKGVLFRGKDPAFVKTDRRLRNIPFPTKKATFKEVKRIYDMLSSIEIYGAADNFKDRFPPNPDKRIFTCKSKKDSSSSVVDYEKKEHQQCAIDKGSPKKFLNKTKSSALEKEILEENIQSSSSESEYENENNFELISCDVDVCFQDLVEYEDTVPQFIKDIKNNPKQKKKTKKFTGQGKTKSEKVEWTETFERLQGNLIKSCEDEDKNLLLESLNIYDELPERELSGTLKIKKTWSVFTKEDFIDCLNAPINEENKNTLLHLAAIKGLHEFVPLLLTSGADPAVKNKNKLTPYVIADKETRHSFQLFASSFPNKYNFKKANIPELMTDEKVKEKKEKKKLKRIKEKVKKQEEMEKRNEKEKNEKRNEDKEKKNEKRNEEEENEKRNEEEEKKNFLALSDREKCALAAERRIIASSTSNLKSGKLVLSRCFQCGTDISGIVAFEYGYNRFCTIPCLKAHRLKTNCYGKEI